MIEKIIKIIKKGTAEIIAEEELADKLKKKQSLIIKFGCDPTSPDIHLGHMVILNKLKTMQNLGHKVHCLIGDFTAEIGDPTGKNKTRPLLRSQIIQNNAYAYKKQILKILNPKTTKFYNNKSWFNHMNAQDIIKLARYQTVAKMLTREEFNKRYKLKKSIGIHEFLYPIIQGYDSFKMQADIEIGGTDQKFNLLMGREIQKKYSQEAQVIITMPILEGLDGFKKMSKSENNYIGIREEADQIFGKIMSISDETMWKYFELLSDKSLEEIQDLKIKTKKGKNLRDIKYTLAKEIVSKLHNNNKATIAHKNFINQFQKRKIPDNVINIHIKKSIPLKYILKIHNIVKSTSEIKRLFQQGAIKLNKIKLTDFNYIVTDNIEKKPQIYQIGKRKFIKILFS